VSDEREQKVVEVAQKYREPESEPAGGVGVSVPGAPDALPVYSGGAKAFTPAAVSILRELWELTQAPDGGQILIDAYWRYRDEEKDNAPAR
jgi:hypothetical protein